MKIGWTLALSLMTGPVVAEEPIKVAVLDVQTSGIEGELGAVLTEILTAEVHELGRFSVVTGRDIDAMLDMEKQKELVGCTDASCMADIAGALGVAQVVVSHVGKVGRTHVVNIKLLDIASAQVKNRVYETVGGEIDAVISTIKTAVHKLFRSQASPATTTATAPNSGEQGGTEEGNVPVDVAPTPVTSSASVTAQGDKPGVGIVPIVLWGVGAAGIATGVVAEVLARRSYTRVTDTQYVGEQRDIATGQTQETIAGVAFGAGAASVAAGFLVWWLTGDDSRSDRVALTPVAGHNGVGLVITLGL